MGSPTTTFLHLAVDDINVVLPTSFVLFTLGTVFGHCHVLTNEADATTAHFTHPPKPTTARQSRAVDEMVDTAGPPSGGVRLNSTGLRAAVRWLNA